MSISNPLHLVDFKFNLDHLFTSQELLESLVLPKHKKVLVVEDDLSQIILIEELIREINHEAEIDWETNAKKAMLRVKTAKESLNERPYDIIISDVVLEGGGSGVDLIRFCQKIQPKILTVLVSAYSKEKLSFGYFKEFVPKTVIQKPINFAHFRHEVGRALCN